MGGLRFLPVWLVAGFAVGLGAAVGVALASTVPAPGAATPAPAPVGATPAPSLPDVTDADDVACDGASLEERAGQVLVVGLPGVTAPDDPLVDEVARLGVGGVLITKTNVESEWQVRALVRSLRRASDRALLVTTDEEPGRVSSFGAVLGRTSSARTLAARGEPQDVRDFARDLGRQLSSFGVDADLAPVVDIDDGPAGGIIGDRSFSGDQDTVTAYGLAFSEGLAAAGVLPTAKHFPGHGRSHEDTHISGGHVDVPLEALRAEDLLPFIAQIQAGVPLVMVNHVAFSALDPALPASLASPTYELLRELGFEGVAMTDSVGMGAIHQTWDFHTSVVMAIRAGADAVLATDGNVAGVMRDALVAAVRNGELDEDRLDEAAARMLALKGEDPEPIVCRDVAPIPVMDLSQQVPRSVERDRSVLR